MSHIVIIVGVFICAIKAAMNAGEIELKDLLIEIRERGKELQVIEFDPQSPEHGQQTEAINNANNFAQSVCDENTENRLEEGQNILNAINALL